MSAEYGASNIQVLKGLEAVRKRPGMYIGSTGPRGLHHLVYETVDNSIDEAMAGFCDTITVALERDDIVRVVDNGRGIPVDIHPTEKISALELVLTRLHSRSGFHRHIVSESRQGRASLRRTPCGHCAWRPSWDSHPGHRRRFAA